jgi:hypothetical protein
LKQFTVACTAVLLCLATIFAGTPVLAGEIYTFAVEAPDVPSVHIWVATDSMHQINNLVVDKKVTKRTKIGDKSYFIAKIPKDKALTGDRFCADVPVGWLVKWKDDFVGDDGGPGRTLCTEVGPLTWVDGVTYHKLETRSEAAQIALGEGFQYDVGPGVPADQLTLIKTGFWIADSYLNRVYGGAIPPEIRAGITVKVEATGKGNQDRFAGGACCTGLAENGPRPYFDVKHPQWAQDSRGRGWTTETDSMKSVIHEYAHAWQATLGAMTIYSQPLGNWIDEGIGEYLGYSALIDAGRMSRANADLMEFNGAVSNKEFEPSLQAMQTTQTPVWPGHGGYVAIEWLVDNAPRGPLSLRVLATSIGAGKSVDEAFFAAFGVTLADFYPQFESWKKAIKKNPAKAATGKHPKLVLSATGPAAASIAPPAIEAEPTADELFRKGYDADTGSDGVAKDDAEAFKWYTLAAAKGQLEATRNLAGMYGSGRGTATNDTEARRLFHVAADGGDAAAQYALGKWYSEGRDFSIKWFRLAAKQGHADAIAELKQMGVGLE